jgi:rRNA maturation endonuclease Nob1
MMPTDVNIKRNSIVNALQNALQTFNVSLTHEQAEAVVWYVGQAIGSDMVCTECAAEIHTHHKFCWSCGEKQ